MRIAAVLPLALLAVGACGETGEQLAAIASPEGVAAAAESSFEAGTSTLEFEATIDASSVGVDEPLVMRGEGAQDLANGRAVISTDMSSILDMVGGEIPPEAAAAFSEPLDVYQDGTDMYMCGGPVAALAEECVHMDIADVVGEQAATEALSGSNADPAAMMRMLQGAGEVEEVGTEEIDGVATTHLRGTMTVAQSLERLSDDAEEDYRRALTRMGFDEADFETPIAFEVWVGDDDRLIYRMIQEMEVPTPTGTMSATYDMRFSDHGESVDIEIPTDFVEATDVMPVPGG